MAIARSVLADRGRGDATLVAEDAIDQADPLDVEGESVQRLDLRRRWPNSRSEIGS